MNPMNQPPKNCTRVMLKWDSALVFAYYKDGMYQVDGERHRFIWRPATDFNGWISIEELKQKLK